MRIVERTKDGKFLPIRQYRGPRVTDEFVEELAQMGDATSLSYKEACAAYLAWSKEQPGNPQMPNEGISDECYGVWHLENVNGPLAVVTAKGEVFSVDEFHSAYERLSEEGLCDAPGGMEYRRVLAEWIEYFADDLDEFIIRRANVGPMD